MGAEATLRPDSFPVAPGGEARAEISVKNTGRVVDSFELSVIGEAGAWSACEPSALSLFPGQSATANIIVRPPFGSHVPHGPLPFGIRVSSSEDPDGSVVEEGVLDVAPMPLVTAELTPRTGRARGLRASRHKVAVENHGNAPSTVDLYGGDAADTVYVQVSPAQLVVGGGGALSALVRVRARRRFWRGPAENHPFFVVASAQDGEPERCDATMIQRAVIPSWLPRTLAMAAAGVAALIVLWFALLRPLVANTAANAAHSAAGGHSGAPPSPAQNALPGAGAGAGGGGGSSPASSATVKPPASKKASASASAKASQAVKASPSGSTSAQTTTTTPPPPPPAQAAAKPFMAVLSSAATTLATPAGHSFGITDMLVENPAGDQGLLTISVNGVGIYAEQLADYPEFDAHWVTPIVVPAGQKVTLSVACANAGGAACSATVLITGMNTAS